MNDLSCFDPFASLSGVFLRVGLPGKLLGQRRDLPVVSVTGHAEQYGTESRRHVRSQRGSAGGPRRSSHPPTIIHKERDIHWQRMDYAAGHVQVQTEGFWCVCTSNSAGCTRTPCCQHLTLDTMGICDGTRTHRACMWRRSKVTVFVRNLQPV